MFPSHLRPSMTQKISGPDGHHSGVEAFIRERFPLRAESGDPSRGRSCGLGLVGRSPEWWRRLKYRCGALWPPRSCPIDDDRLASEHRKG
jgi:hypothetical protein